MSAALPAQGRRPNILWLVSEDNNPFIGAYGDKLAHTPNIDRLAREGVLFRNAYSNAPVCSPTRFTILTGVHSQSCAPANQMRAIGKAAGILQTYPEVMRAAGYYCTNSGKTDYNCDIDANAIWDANGKDAHWRNRPEGKPFLSVFNFGITHESSIFQPTAGKVSPADVRVPAYLPDTPGIRQDCASYYNLIEKMDGQIGEKLAELADAGLADDTIIFYYSDNGGVLPRSKRYCTDEGLRCALVVYLPPKWAHLAPAKPGSAFEAPVSYVDLAPTIIAIAGARAPATMQGKPFLGPSVVRQTYAFGMRNRMDERTDFVRSVTDGRYRYIRNYMPHLPLVQNQAFAWLARGYQDWDALNRQGKLSPVQAKAFQPRVYEEFYDLQVDPDGVDNLIANQDHSGRIAAMRRALDTEILRIVDNGFIPEGAPLEGYLPSRAAGAYPLKRIMALAQAAGRRDQRKIALFERALGDPNDVVRYWGAMGLLLLGDGAQKARPALENVMRADPLKQVRIVAAEALIASGQPGHGIATLGDLLGETETVPVRVQALNALTRIGEPARAVLPQIRAACRAEVRYVADMATYLVQELEGTFDPHKPVFDLEKLMQAVRTSGMIS
ncbi:sulfatase-like hydrolase/transferase [Sphingobium sp.]|uniref:sulfatase-like hydrolase/transferase n=1 Tax=Sphingobium sp. TaxID=1912891 RepID=UPI0035C6F991